MDKLENLTWEGGNPIPAQIEINLDEKDKKYYEQYNQLISKYSSKQSLIEMDLTKDYTPPRDLYVEVRALENIEGIKTKEGTIRVEKNNTYTFRKSDIEIYIRRGYFAINE